MKDKLLQIRVDEDFLSKLEYLQKINGFKTVAETVRKVIEKEYRKEKYINSVNDAGEQIVSVMQKTFKPFAEKEFRKESFPAEPEPTEE